MKQTSSRTLSLLAVCGIALLTSCGSGLLEIDFGPGVDPDNPEASGFGAPSSNTSANPADPTTGGAGVTPTPGDPAAPTGPPPILNNATFGSRCLEGTAADFLVLSDAVSDCGADARRLDSLAAGPIPGAAALALDGTTQFQQAVEYCASPGQCETVTLSVTFDGVSSGRWSGVVGGQAYDVPFNATGCAYDAVVDPLPGETPAAGISIDEVAVYQGVKVPVVQNGATVNQLNAPVVAGRAGIVRVFVQPEADWQPRDLRVRLTIGDVVKEEVFQPMGASAETEGDSTVNFSFAPGELPSEADFSVELLEAQACAAVPGQVAQPRVPAADTAPLGSQGLASNMQIVLVPVAYDADGSGRLPDLGATAMERYRQEALTHYPVPDVEISVRDAVSYSGGLSPNGSGFGEALNFCLNVRANDNPDNDVYYYCVFQPATSKQAFCGGGCVAGVAPVPGANDVGSRGGIGISFGGDGEGVFVHELGHTLGRPHSPCGGAAGTDPNYPYAQGLIGSWGYDIMNGQLLQPDQRADFMGYCEPTWVSDYTYGLIFDRLRSVIGSQQFLVQTPPTQWRTAVLQDGALRWGGSKTLRRLPTGLPVPASLRDGVGAKMGEPEVYITPVADIDAVLLTIEDRGDPGQTVDIPGYGTLRL